MRKILIYGTTDFSKEVRYYIESDRYGEVAAYVLDRQYVTEKRYDDLEVIAYEELEQHYAKDEIEILITLGYSQMNDNRKKVFEKCKANGWRIGSFIHSSAENLSASIGEGNIIMDKVELRLHTAIGNGNIFLTKTVLSHESTVGDFNYFAGSNHIDGHNRIGNNNFLGTDCILTHEGRIGDYNLIGAGVCLGKNLGDHMMAAPAAVRTRSMSKRAMDLLLMGKMRSD